MDIQYFADNWHSKSSSDIWQDKSFWDERADNWVKNFDSVSTGDGDGKVIQDIEKLLLDEGILFSGAEVIDIGCGPGKYSARFAKTAAHVTALDLSDSMLFHAGENAKKAGCHNISFVSAPFQHVVPSEYGWEKKFDLVFSSLCPAVASYESMQKICDMSKGYCFNRTFAYRNNDFLDEMHRVLMGTERNSPFKSNSLICTFGILSLMGYFPGIRYMDTYTCYRHELGEHSARDYAMLLNHKKEPEPEMLKEVQAYLESAAVDGVVTENVHAKSALIWWNINDTQ